jgi:hypothetical protein
LELRRDEFTARVDSFAQSGPHGRNKIEDFSLLEIAAACAVTDGALCANLFDALRSENRSRLEVYYGVMRKSFENTTVQ